MISRTLRTVPANHLERVLWGEAERMGSLVIDDANFASEREVVKEELRQSVFDHAFMASCSRSTCRRRRIGSPSGRPGIGSMQDLDAATVGDVRAFHAAYYRPDNAVMVVSGNFDQKQLDAYREMLCRHQTPARPIPRVTAVEPERKEAKSYYRL